MTAQRPVVDMDRPWTRGAERLRTLLNKEPFIRGLGALTGSEAKQVQAGLNAIYFSGGRIRSPPSMTTRPSGTSVSSAQATLTKSPK